MTNDQLAREICRAIRGLPPQLLPIIRQQLDELQPPPDPTSFSALETWANVGQGKPATEDTQSHSTPNSTPEQQAPKRKPGRPRKIQPEQSQG